MDYQLIGFRLFACVGEVMSTLTSGQLRRFS